VTHLRQIMLEELGRRNYAAGTIRCYIRVVEQFARHFHWPPDQLAWNISDSTRQCCCGRRSWLQALSRNI
jgi:hypothetical protein